MLGEGPAEVMCQRGSAREAWPCGIACTRARGFGSGWAHPAVRRAALEKSIAHLLERAGAVADSSVFLSQLLLCAAAQTGPAGPPRSLNGGSTTEVTLL